MKKLFVFTCDNGDGSRSCDFTMNEDFVAQLIELYNNDQLDYESCPYIDGDGLSYKTLTVPDECTLKSLGVSFDAAENGIEEFWLQ